MEQTQNPHNGSNIKQGINNNRTTALERTAWLVTWTPLTIFDGDRVFIFGTIRGVACQKFNVRNCLDVVNAFMPNIEKGAFTNSVDPDDTPLLKAASHQDLHNLPY